MDSVAQTTRGRKWFALAGSNLELDLDLPGRGMRAMLFAGMLLITLSDFYFPSLGVPVVPMMGLVLFLVVTLQWPVSNVDRAERLTLLNTWHRAVLLVALYFVSALWGLLAFKSGTVKGALGMGLGTVLMAALLSRETSASYRATVYRFCSILLIVHVGFWLLQCGYTLITQTFLDYIKPITGTPTRHGLGIGGVDTGLQRFTGLFAEPSIYVTNIYFLLTARLMRSGMRVKALDVVAMGTVAGSLSITGILLVVFMLSVCLVRSIRSVRAAFAVAAVVIACVAAAIPLADSDIGTMISTRLNAPSNDASGRIRTVDAVSTYTHLPEAAQIFGVGVGNTEMVPQISNGILDILTSLGVIGLAVFFVLLASMLHLRSVPITLWLFVAAMLPGGPYFTIQGWWMWLGMMAIFWRDAAASAEKMSRKHATITGEPVLD